MHVHDKRHVYSTFDLPVPSLATTYFQSLRWAGSISEPWEASGKVCGGRCVACDEDRAIPGDVRSHLSFCLLRGWICHALNGCVIYPGACVGRHWPTGCCHCHDVVHDEVVLPDGVALPDGVVLADGVALNGIALPDEVVLNGADLNDGIAVNDGVVLGGFVLNDRVLVPADGLSVQVLLQQCESF